MSLKASLISGILASLAIEGVSNVFSYNSKVVFYSTFAVVFALCQIHYYWIFPTYCSPLRHLPGPKNHTYMLGHLLHELKATKPGVPYISWVRQWPEAQLIRYMTYGNNEALLVSGLDAYKFLSGNDGVKFIKPNWYKNLTKSLMCGFGILSISGEEHRQLRKKMNPAFSYSRLSKLIPQIYTKARDYSKHLDSVIATNDGVFDCGEYYSRVTLDIIGLTTTGVDLLNMSLDSDSIVHAAYMAAFAPKKLSQALLMLDTVVPVRWLPLAENAEFNVAFERVEKRIMDITTERRRQIRAELAGEDMTTAEWADVLTTIMRDAERAGDPLSDKEIMCHLVTLLAAGHETTATCMLWVSYELSENTDLQDRLRAEVQALLAENPEPSYTDIDNLPFMDAFFREVLRVHPMAITTPREAATDLEICGTRIPKGTPLMLMPMAINRNPAIWGPTVDEFIPERWMGPDRAEQIAKSAAFYGGPRSCIGKVIAMMEMKIIMVEMISKFRLSLPHKQNMDIFPFAITNRPHGSLHIKVERL